MAVIESESGRPLLGRVLAVTSSEAVRLRGWASVDPGTSRRRRGGRAYVVLTADDLAWHAPVGARHARSDVLRAVLGRSHRRRKIIRVIDRLPPALARLIRRVWGGDDRFGFDTWLSLAGLPAGRWDVGVAQSSPRGASFIDTGLTLDVTA
jgi:hypothetical protein